MSPIRPAHLALILLVIAIWSCSFAVSKWGVQEMPPFFFAALRFLIVAVLLLPFVPRPRGQWRPILAVSLLLGVLHFACMFLALVRTPSATVALIVQLQVPFSALLAALCLGDRLGWRRALGMLLAFGGVALVLGTPSFASPWWSDLLVVFAALFWALSAIQIKRIGHGVSGATINAWVAAFAVPQLLLLSFLVEEGQWAALAGMSWGLAGSLLYNGVLIVVLGYSIWYRMLRIYDVNQVMPFMLLQPPLAVLLGGLLLDEPLTPLLALGGALTLAGVGIIMLRRPRLLPPEAERA